MGGFTSVYTATPTSTLTRPADTTAYSQNDLIASSATAGSVVVPSVAAARLTENAGTIIRAKLETNATSGWGTTFSINLWSSAPTYANGDNGAYSVATGAAVWLGTITLTLTQFSDGAVGAGVPTVGNGILFALPVPPAIARNQTEIYWDLQYTGSGSLTPISAQTFTLTLETFQT